jgi:hypothetical protein
MKPSGRKVKHKLLLEEEPNDRFIGLVSGDADYQVSMYLNQKLNINLKSSNPVGLKTNQGNEVFFSRFTSSSTFNDLTIDLISNRSGKEFLTKKYQDLDYILKLKSSTINESFPEIVNNIRTIDGIIAVFLLEDKLQLEENILELIP